MGRIIKNDLDMKEEVLKRKSDPNWPKTIASCVIQRYQEESKTDKLRVFSGRRLLAAAAILLVGISIGWFAVNSSLPQEEEFIREVSWIWEGDFIPGSYISVLESNF
ncbi:hypothetical protein [Leptospira fainei]|nr:hypothetical protein [Leptospira fainei]